MLMDLQMLMERQISKVFHKVLVAYETLKVCSLRFLEPELITFIGNQKTRKFESSFLEPALTSAQDLPAT